MDSLEREARERKKQAFALAILPLSLGFFVWRLQTGTSTAPPPKTPAASVVAKAAPVVAATVGPVMSLEKQRIVAVPAGNRDPFMPAIDVTPSAASPSVKVAEGRKATVKPISVTEMGGMPSLPLANPALHPFGTPTPVTPVPKPPESTIPTATVTPMAPPMPYVLCGIVKGNPDVAVLRHFDGSRRIVRAGETFDRGFHITSIQETSVVLVGDGQCKTLRLGGDNPAPPVTK